MANEQPEFLVIGRIMAPWGYQGHMKVAVETDFPQRYSEGAQIYIEQQPTEIEDVAWHKGRAIIKVRGIDTDTRVEELAGQLIEVHNSQLFDLQEGEYFHFQLIGLKVETTGGELIGEITDILTMASADVYVVKSGDEEILIPATDEVVQSIDLEKGLMIIEPITGLLDLNEKKPKK